MPKTYYTVANGMMLGERTDTGPRIDYVPDALGSIVAAVDQDLNTTYTAAYKPCGDTLASTGTAPNFTWVGNLGYLKSAGVTYAEFSVRRRIYSSRTGRWTSVDPRWPRHLAYPYASSSPVGLVDFTGLASVTFPTPCCCCALDFEPEDVTYYYDQTLQLPNPPGGTLLHFCGIGVNWTWSWSAAGAGGYISSPCFSLWAEWRSDELGAGWQPPPAPEAGWLLNCGYDSDGTCRGSNCQIFDAPGISSDSVAGITGWKYAVCFHFQLLTPSNCVPVCGTFNVDKYYKLVVTTNNNPMPGPGNGVTITFGPSDSSCKPS